MTECFQQPMRVSAKVETEQRLHKSVRPQVGSAQELQPEPHMR